MIIHFDRRITQNNPSLFKYIESKGLFAPIYYIIDSKYRTSVGLSRWLSDNLSSDEVTKACAAIDRGQDPDYIVTDILRWVAKNIKYTSDPTVWEMSERWQTPAETLRLRTGDCEDGAILMYAMAIECGVPAERLLIFAGSVDGGGHAWLGYRASEYPLNWCFEDWCYWLNPASPSSRTKYYIRGQTIYNDPKRQYYSIWFAFNHISSYKGVTNEY